MKFRILFYLKKWIQQTFCHLLKHGRKTSWKVIELLLFLFELLFDDRSYLNWKWIKQTTPYFVSIQKDALPRIWSLKQCHQQEIEKYLNIMKHDFEIKIWLSWSWSKSYPNNFSSQWRSVERKIFQRRVLLHGLERHRPLQRHHPRIIRHPLSRIHFR